MSFRERSPQGHPAKQHEAAERMKRPEPSLPLFQEAHSTVGDRDSPTPPCRRYPNTGDERRKRDYGSNESDPFSPPRSGYTPRNHHLEDSNSPARSAWLDQISTHHSCPLFPFIDERLFQELEPRIERLTEPGIYQQMSPQLPSFKELLDFTKNSPDAQSAPARSYPPAMDHSQTASASAPRQSSAERPVFHDPFRGVSQPLGLSARRSASLENYTAQIEARPSLLQARPSANYDPRRTSLRPDYEPRVPSEPRAPSLPSIFTPRITPQTSVISSTAPQVYHQPGGYSTAIPVTEVHRYNEAAYGHLAYPNEHHVHRSPFASDHARPSVRHDSSVFPTSEHHWISPPYAYQTAGGYVYALDPPNGMDHCPHSNRRRRGNLPKEATALLKKWFQDHAESPYPTDEDKNRLAVDTGLSSAQISNWFINARRRTPGKEAREQARTLASNKSSGQQQAQGTNGIREQDHGVQPSASSPLQQPRHPSQQHAEQRYSLAQMQAPKPYPYDPRDHSHDRDHEMGNA